MNTSYLHPFLSHINTNIITTQTSTLRWEYSTTQWQKQQQN